MLKVKRQYFITFFRNVCGHNIYLPNVGKIYEEMPTNEQIEEELNSIKDIETIFEKSNINIEIKKHFVISKSN